MQGRCCGSDNGHVTILPEKSSAPAEGTDRVRADAERRGITIEIVQRPAADSLEQAAEILGFAPSVILKSLVVKRSDGTFLFALIPGDRQLSWPKLRAVVGVNKLQLPNADQAFAATGYERGTITPLGSSTAWPVYIDSRASGRIAMGAGAHGYSAWVDAAELIAGFGATNAEISD